MPRISKTFVTTPKIRKSPPLLEGPSDTEHRIPAQSDRNQGRMLRSKLLFVRLPLWEPREQLEKWSRRRRGHFHLAEIEPDAENSLAKKMKNSIVTKLNFAKIRVFLQKHIIKGHAPFLVDSINSQMKEHLPTVSAQLSTRLKNPILRKFDLRRLWSPCPQRYRHSLQRPYHLKITLLAT